MAVEMNKTSSVRLTPVQEIKLAKPATELYVGQILKTVVVTALTNNQVLININGQNLNAKTSHHFTPGELLEVKVVANQGETILEVQQKSLAPSVLQAALLQALPKQAPPTQLFATLQQLLKDGSAPPALTPQIKAILGAITPLSQLPNQLSQAINQSGVFLESILLKLQRNRSCPLKSDFKAQCLKLLNSLPDHAKIPVPTPPTLGTNNCSRDPLPLPGAIPQPLTREPLSSLLGEPAETIQHILHEQVTQVLARITTNQLNHLNQNNQDGYLIMLDLPIKTNDRIDVIPLMIKQHKAEPMQPSKWSISFAVSLAELGDMQGAVSIQENDIDITMNADKASTVELLYQSHADMGQVLEDLGLNLRQWQLKQGLENNQIDVANLKLLDIRI